MAKKWGIDYLHPRAELWEIVNEIQSCKQRELLALGISPSALGTLQGYRNLAVHARPIQKQQAKTLVERVIELLDRLYGN